MTIDKDTLYMGVMVFGGLIILVVAILIFKSTPAKNTSDGNREKPRPAPKQKEKKTSKQVERKTGNEKSLFSGMTTAFSGLIEKARAGLNSRQQEIMR